MTPWIRASLTAALLLQIVWHGSISGLDARAKALEDPPGLTETRLASLDETILASRLTMLYLQSFDIQPGIIIPFRDLDYEKVKAWLELSQRLDERDAYPLFAASNLYLGVEDPGRKKAMLDFIYGEFLKDPEERWPWMAKGALAAQYGLHDRNLALKYAEALGRAPNAPAWAVELPLFVMENMNEADSAKIWLGGLIAGGRIRDGNELRFLGKTLENRQQK